jgi:hypothetical protein
MYTCSRIAADHARAGDQVTRGGAAPGAGDMPAVGIILDEIDCSIEVPADVIV